MSAPTRVTEWIRRAYPKPTVDPDWLEACLAWICEELHLDDINSQAAEILSNVDSQLLHSDLRDSMVAGTGFPLDIGSAENTRLRGNILVQIQAMTEIGHSAFSLQNVHQTRLDRADLTGLTEDGGEDEGPIPKFPRSMLSFDLSDGSVSLRAIEFQRLPELEFGVTPLGYKLILKDVPVRRGIAFLEPSNVELKGCMTEELDANREADFIRGLRMRLGRPGSEPHEVPEQGEGTPRNDLLPENVNRLTVTTSRAPLREMSIDGSNICHPPNAPRREAHEPPTRRRVPSSSNATFASTSSAVVSPYFSNPASTSVTTRATSSSHGPSRSLSSGQVAPSSPNGVLHQLRAIEDTDFSDDLQMDDAFFQELDAAERVAFNIVQRANRTGQAPHVRSESGTTTAAEHSEVIVIDSDSDDKENLVPVMQRRVRQRLARLSEDEPEVIVIE